MLFFKVKKKKEQKEKVINGKKVATAEEVNEDFDRAASEVLRQAEEILKAERFNEKAAMLYSLGFTGTKDVCCQAAKTQSIEEAREEKRVIEYYQKKYPLHKFIPTETAEKLCKKYGLLMGDSHLYKGSVPMKNVLEIKNFKGVKIEDHIFLKTERYGRGFRTISFDDYRMYYQEALDDSDRPNYLVHAENSRETGTIIPIQGEGNIPTQFTNGDYLFRANTGFRICATADEMIVDSSSKVEEGVYIVDKDPIVLYPVKGGYLKVTAWGPEALDEELINPKDN